MPADVDMSDMNGQTHNTITHDFKFAGQVSKSHENCAESVDTDLNVRPPSTRRNFAPDPLLINDQQPEESWYVFHELLILEPTISTNELRSRHTCSLI